MDDVFDGGAVKTCLESNFWNFGTRTIRLESDPSVETDFGFTKAFKKPDDWCRTAVVSYSEYLRPALKDDQFSDESGYWFADIDTLYVKMVSDGADYGGDLSMWTEAFTRYFEAYLAERIAFKLTRSKKTIEMIADEVKKRLKGASAKDAMDSGTSLPPEGSWNRARRDRGGTGRRDGGTRRQLIG